VVRHGVLVGSAVAVLMVIAGAALVLSGANFFHPTPVGKPAPLSPDSPPTAAAENAKQPVAPQPSAPVSPSFDVVKVGPTGTAVIAGRAEPGSRVTVRDGDHVIGEATADRRGEWVVVPDQPIGPGDRLLSLEAIDPKGGPTIRSDETVALSVSPAKRDNEETALAVVLPREGGGPARVLQRPDGSAPNGPATVGEAVAAGDKRIALAIDALEYDPDGRVMLSGHATPGATVEIYADNQPLATATANAAGEWSAKSDRTVPGKQAELRLDQLGKDGRVVQRIAVPSGKVAAMAPTGGQTYTVQRGNSLWQISRLTYGAGPRYLMIYSANLAQIRDPERIYPGQVFKLPNP